MPAQKIAVLVVEDEALISMDITFYLEAEGFKVYEASNADVAIHVLAENDDIGLVFTDVDMPGSMDGLKLAASVHRHWPPVKIIVTSGARLVEITDIPDGSVFFSKPYDHTVLLRTIRTMLA